MPPLRVVLGGLLVAVSILWLAALPHFEPDIRDLGAKLAARPSYYLARFVVCLLITMVVSRIWSSRSH